jgi:membrane protease YdiL (CAAX protease family)
MKNKRTSKTQLVNFAPGSYFERTSRPVYAVVFLLPFIIFYEIGTILINTDLLNQSQVRVVAFIWLQNLLEQIGFAYKLTWIAPPLAVIIILIALQITSRKKWTITPIDLPPMALECILLAVPLIVLNLSLNTSTLPKQKPLPPQNTANVTFQKPLQTCAAHTTPALSAENHNQTSAGHSLMANIVTGIGAGIYEELIFRLILICLLMILFQDLLRLKHRHSIILAVLISAALFSAHHHIIFLDGRFGQSAPFNWLEFGFRTLAGVYFAALFAVRGFAVTAGTHAFYDIIATLVNAYFFQQ